MRCCNLQTNVYVERSVLLWKPLDALEVLRHSHDPFNKFPDLPAPSIWFADQRVVERSALLWKPPDALELLRQACVIAAELTEGQPAAAAAEAALSGPAAAAATAASASGVPVSTKEDARAAAAAAEGIRLEDWECVRREAFPAVSGM